MKQLKEWMLVQYVLALLFLYVAYRVQISGAPASMYWALVCVGMSVYILIRKPVSGRDEPPNPLSEVPQHSDGQQSPSLDLLERKLQIRQSLYDKESEREVLEKEKKEKYRAYLHDALAEQKSTFSALESMELRRRLNTVSAILHVAIPHFSQIATKKLKLESRWKFDKLCLMWVASLSASWILDLFLEIGTIGPYNIKFMTFISWIIFLSVGTYLLFTCWQEFQVGKMQGTIDELRYRWTANGGDPATFLELRMFDDASSEIFYDSDGFWWGKVEAALYKSIQGHSPHWRS